MNTNGKLQNFEIELTSAKWQIWYQDNFDRECPRLIECEGVDLIQGLQELWLRHLFETLQPNGTLGFSRFNLWWLQRKTDVVIKGNIHNLIIIKNWVVNDRKGSIKKYRQFADLHFLERIAFAHCLLIINNDTAEPIINLVSSVKSKKEFDQSLSTLIKNLSH